MPIAEGSGVSLRYKAYASGAMAAAAEADPATDPGATGGQVLRFTQSSLNLRANSTTSAEILPSRQVRSNRRTSRRVEGSISGELSPATYFDLFEAVLRGSRSAVSGTPGDGQRVMAPASGHVRRKFMFERYHQDLDKSRLYTECRVTGFRLAVPAEGISTVEFMVMGRNRLSRATGASPYLTAPAAATTTEVCNSLAGAITLDGTPVGLVTAAAVNCANAAEAPQVLGQAFPPDVLLGRTAVDGSLTFLLDDGDTASALFESEAEVAVALTLTNATSGGESITVELPRVKLTSADEETRGDLSQPITCAFTALEYVGAADGVPLTTIRITDSAAVA